MSSCDINLNQLKNLSIMDRVFKVRIPESTGHLTTKSSMFTASVQQETQTMDRVKKTHIGVVGAGLAGLRSADVLLDHGFRVTILEARDRIGGRMYQETLANCHTVDMGPNWIHGTKGNPMLELATETGTAVSNGEQNTSCVFDEDGQLLPLKDGERFSTIMWDIVGEAFEYSNRCGSEIDTNRTLRDYFEEQVKVKIPDNEDDYKRKRHIVLQTAELWGSFIGSPVEKQSLKFLWLEECIGGGMYTIVGVALELIGKLTSRQRTHFVRALTRRSLRGLLARH